MLASVYEVFVGDGDLGKRMSMLNSRCVGLKPLFLRRRRAG